MSDDKTCTCREKNILEEIEDLDIDETTKNRIFNKARELFDRCDEVNRFLQNCHSRIYILEKAIVNLAIHAEGVECDI